MSLPGSDDGVCAKPEFSVFLSFPLIFSHWGGSEADAPVGLAGGLGVFGNYDKAAFRGLGRSECHWDDGVEGKDVSLLLAGNPGFRAALTGGFRDTRLGPFQAGSRALLT